MGLLISTSKSGMSSASTAFFSPAIVEEATSKAILFNLESCQVHGVGSDVVTIGSSPRCSVVLADKSLAAQHCMISPSESAGYRLYDLNGQVGCSVNGVKVLENSRIYDGDEISVGAHSFVFNLVNKSSQLETNAKNDTQDSFSWMKAFGEYLRGMARL